MQEGRGLWADEGEGPWTMSLITNSITSPRKETLDTKYLQHESRAYEQIIKNLC
jgi:hypothetical protein